MKAISFSISRTSSMVIGLLIAALMVVFAWVGWIGSDDARHIDGALGWYQQFPYSPQHHGEFRHFIALPAALSFTIFGVSDHSAVLPVLLYFFGLLAVTIWQIQTRVDAITALLSVAIISTMSVFSLRATVVYSDIVELFFVIVSMWCFLTCCDKARSPVLLLLLAGILAGGGWLTRETTIALLIFYGFLFIIGFGIERRFYWLMAIGFFLPVLIDALFFWIQSGTPFHRYIEIFSARTNFGLMRSQEGALFNDIGNVQFHPVIDPFLALLVNHEIGLLFYLSPFVAWGLWRDSSIDGKIRQLGILLIAFAVLWFIVTTFLITRYHPRYFTVSSYAMALATAIWLTQIVARRRAYLAALLTCLLITVGSAGIYLENRNPIFGARTLRDLTVSEREVIYTDPETYRRGLLLLRARKAATRVSIEPPTPGVLFLYNPNRVSNREKDCFFRPAADWRPIKVIAEPQKLSARILTNLDIAGLFHPGISRRLLHANSTVTLFRVGNEDACRD